MPTYGIQGNLIPDWDFSSPAAGPPNADWTGWVESEVSGGGVATVEADAAIKHFGAYALQLSITNNADSASVTSAAYIPITKTAHYILRFSNYKVSGANTCDIVIKQYNAVPADLGDDIVITPAGAAAWALSTTVIHAAGEGGNDWNAACTQCKIIIRVDTTVANWRIDGVSLAPAEATHLAAFGSQLFLNGYAIGELTGLTGPSISGDVIDVSSHDSPDTFREFCAGVRDGGEVSLEFNVDLSDTNGQVAFEADLESGTARTFHIIYPSAAAEFTFSGIPTGFEISAPYDDKLSASGSVKVTGKPLFTEATF